MGRPGLKSLMRPITDPTLRAPPGEERPAHPLHQSGSFAAEASRRAPVAASRLFDGQAGGGRSGAAGSPETYFSQHAFQQCVRRMAGSRPVPFAM